MVFVLGSKFREEMLSVLLEDQLQVRMQCEQEARVICSLTLLHAAHSSRQAVRNNACPPFVLKRSVPFNFFLIS